MSRIAKERWLHLFVALAISASVYWGFFYTYLGPIRASGHLPNLPLAVHVHGISFLAWYALLVLQAVLVMIGAMKFHRKLGYASLALAVVMVLSGLLVLTFRMNQGLGGNAPFWANFSLAILSNLALFAGFFTAAILRRNRPDAHRRLIVLAAATGSGAALFRVYSVWIDGGFMAVPSGIAATSLFILAAMLGEKLLLGKVHRIYRRSVLPILLFEATMLGLSFTDAGAALQRSMVATARPFFGWY